MEDEGEGGLPVIRLLGHHSRQTLRVDARRGQRDDAAIISGTLGHRVTISLGLRLLSVRRTYRIIAGNFPFGNLRPHPSSVESTI